MSESITAANRLASMICIQSPAELERLRGDHMQLAEMAGDETIRQMHINLVTWHHEQLIRMVLG